MRAAGADVLEVAVPPGPGLDRMAEPVVKRGLSDALAAAVGREVEIRVVESDVGRKRGVERISPETVREDRLQNLLDREPLLERAVQELDLELMD